MLLDRLSETLVEQSSGWVPVVRQHGAELRKTIFCGCVAGAPQIGPSGHSKPAPLVDVAHFGENDGEVTRDHGALLRAKLRTICKGRLQLRLGGVESARLAEGEPLERAQSFAVVEVEPRRRP